MDSAMASIKGINITGNVWLDGYILTSVASLGVAYSTSLISVVKSVISSILMYLFYNVREYIHKRVYGETLCYIALEDHDDMYMPLKHAIFDSNVKFSNMRQRKRRSFMRRVLDQFDIDTDETWADAWMQCATNLKLSVSYKGERAVDAGSNTAGKRRLKKNFSFEHKGRLLELVCSYKPAAAAKKMCTVPRAPGNTRAGNSDEQPQQSSGHILLVVRAHGSNVRYFQDSETLANAVEEFLIKELDITKRLFFCYTVKTEDNDFARKVEEFLKSTRGPSFGCGKIDVTTDEPPVKLFEFLSARVNSGSKIFASPDMAMKFNTKINGAKRQGDDLVFVETEVVEAVRNDENKKTTSTSGHEYQYDQVFSGQGSYSFFQNLFVPRRHIGNRFGAGFFYQGDKIVMIETSFNSEVRFHIIAFQQRMSTTEVTAFATDLTNTIILSKKKNMLKSEVNIHKYEKGTRDKYEWVARKLDKKSFDTIYLPTKTEQAIRAEIENFMELQKMYTAIQVPFKKGILLHGPPGTGKTSVVKALAYEYQLQVYSINVNDASINDDTIVDVLNSLAGSYTKILLFEDIDTAFSDKEKLAHESRQESCEQPNEDKTTASDKKTPPKEATSYLTYSGLLNALDGVMSNQTGVITIMTTNYIDRLGQAFLRPGRIDAKIYMGPCTHESTVKMMRTLVENRLDVDLPHPVAVKHTQDEYERLIDEFATHICDKDGRSRVRPCELQNYIMSRVIPLQPIFDDWRLLLDSVEEFVE